MAAQASTAAAIASRIRIRILPNSLLGRCLSAKSRFSYQL
jgi:hypothetical protein